MIETIDKPPLRIIPGEPIEDDTAELHSGSFIFHTTTHILVIPEEQKRYIVMEHTVTHGIAPEEFKRFTAELTVPVGRNFDGTVMLAKGAIHIPASNISEAFDAFPALAAEVAPQIQKEARKEMARQKLVIPGKPLIDRLRHNGQDFRVGPEDQRAP